MIPVGRRVLGIGFAFLNTVLSSVGFVLQRKAHLMSEREFHSYRPLWLFGVILYIAAALPDVVAFTMIPQVLCATISCFRLVMVCLLGHLVLGEHLGRRDVHSIGMCTLGTIACVMFGPASDESISVSPSEFHHPKVTIYTVVGLGLLVFLLQVCQCSILRILCRPLSLPTYEYGVCNDEAGTGGLVVPVCDEPLQPCHILGIGLLKEQFLFALASFSPLASEVSRGFGLAIDQVQ